MKKDYNSIKAKDNMKVKSEEETVVPEKKEFKKIIDSQPVRRKQGLAGRLISGVLGPEGLPGIGSYVNEQIIIPAIKNIIVEAVTSGINMVMYGESRPARKGPSSYGPTRYDSAYKPTTNYSSKYSSSPDPHDRKVAPMRYGVQEYSIEERYDAAHVITALTEHADMYGSVSVADYYDLIGVPSQYTDNNYGWNADTILQASIVPVRGGGGYVIKFPPVEVL